MSTKKPLCQVCGEEAIGMQILGCCPSEVCSGHAEKILAEMKPGERKESGACYFWRYNGERIDGE
ncbi:MAG TPA: hypothetical protein VN372_09570 [Methanospirillum sp.]|nr:hypothetical protein [Methanospirillum sp.]